MPSPQKCGRDVTMMILSTQNQVFKKILVNTNQYDKFGVSMTFGLGVRQGAFLLPQPCLK